MLYVTATSFLPDDKLRELAPEYRLESLLS